MNLNEKAVYMASFYQENDNVQAVILAGSVSRNLGDHHSDIELHVLWKEPPSDSDRMGPVKRGNGILRTFYPYEEGEWSETYHDESGVKFEISSFLTRTISEVIHDVKEKLDVSYEKQCLLAAVQDGVVLHGHHVGEILKEEMNVYPEALAEKMIKIHLDFGSPWRSRKALCEREDWLMFYSVMCGVHHNLFGILHGLNQMYVKHPSFKWMKETLEQMDVKPERMSERLTYIFEASPAKALQETEHLVKEVVRLVGISDYKGPLQDEIESYWKEAGPIS